MATMPVNIPRQVGLYVARSRKAQSITRAKLAELAGVSERSLASLEVGDATGIRLDKLLAIYDALGLSLLTRGEGIDEANEDSTSTAGEPASRVSKSSSNQPRQAKAFRCTKSHLKSKRVVYPSDYNLALNDFIQNYTNVSLGSPVSFTEKRD